MCRLPALRRSVFVPAGMLARLALALVVDFIEQRTVIL